MTTAPSITTFSRIEVASMLDATPSAWWRAFIQVGVSTGLRVTEALWLAWTDIDVRGRCVLVNSRPVHAAGCRDAIARPTLPIHRERVLPAGPELMESLARFRELASPGSLVFVPDWKLDQLWPSMMSNATLRSQDLAPGLARNFGFIQRMARLRLAHRLEAPLEVVRWHPRPLEALRNTFAVRAATGCSLRELAECLGVRDVRAAERALARAGSAATTGGD